MKVSTFDQITRMIAGKSSRRTLFGAAIGVVGAKALREAPVFAQEAEPSPSQYDPATTSASDSSSEIQYGAVYGNFDGFCKVVPFRDIDGLAVMGDDVILGLSKEIAGTDCVLRSGQAAPIEGQQYRWPNGVVPYFWHESVSDEMKSVVIQAIEYWNGLSLGLTWVDWREVSAFYLQTAPDQYSDNRVVWIKQAPRVDSCHSNVGHRDAPQDLVVGANCSVGNTIHEMAHTAGLWHEQQRPDRDSYVKIAWENLLPEMVSNFMVQLVDLDGIPSPYDYGSIMHYPADAFTANGRPTIITPNGEPIGQRRQLSPIDISALQRMYPYPPVCMCTTFGTACECSW